MKKQLAIALTAALLTFPATPGLVMADTTADSGTTAVTATTIQTDSTGSSTSTSAATNTDTSTTVPTATTSTSTTTTSSAITAPVVDQNGQTVNSGALPDSPWYWFQTLMEKVQLALTFDPVKKAELTEKQATEDLAEAQALLEKGNTTEAEKALTRYNQRIDSAQAFLDQLKDPNSETAQKVQLALTKVNTNNMVVLGSLLEKLPPQAAQRLALNIVRSVEKAVAKAEKTDKKGQDSAAGTTTSTTQSTATVSADQTGTTDQVQLSQEAKQALEEFQVALGVKHTPNGYAYGHYKNKDKEEKDGEDQDDQEDQEKTTNSNSSTTSGQTTQQPQVQQQTQKQAQTQQQAQQQYQKHQSQLNQSGNNSDEKNHEEQERNENGDKSDKEKGHR
ncbi:DUF5667 domain-containing protein [Desulfitobacterium sp. Sab5]|uniref:DUF5667 domain-containing protein n=1 Tax=Desulfitobacterium nosdiversum TaxID=3375356 RepID=UPI003CF03808